MIKLIDYCKLKHKTKDNNVLISIILRIIRCWVKIRKILDQIGIK